MDRDPGSLLFEETVPDHLVVYAPSTRRDVFTKRKVAKVATVERRCGQWLWWMEDGSAIGIEETFEGARAAVGGAYARDANPTFRPPTREEVRAYADDFCRSRRRDPALFDEDAFFDWYEATGWTVNKGTKPMRDWRFAVINWIRREDAR